LPTEKRVHETTLGSFKSAWVLLTCAWTHWTVCQSANYGVFHIFSSIFHLKCLGTWDEFALTFIVFKNLLRTIDFHSSYPLILHVVSSFFELHYLSIKRLKKPMELHD